VSEVRSLQRLGGRVGAYRKWANSEDRTAATEPARKAFNARFADAADPDSQKAREGTMGPPGSMPLAFGVMEGREAPVGHRTLWTKERPTRLGLWKDRPRPRREPRPVPGAPPSR